MVIRRDVRFTDGIQNPDHTEVSLDLVSHNRKDNPLLIEEENSKSLKVDNEKAINNDIEGAEVNSEVITDNPTVRVSRRQTKGKEPRRLIDEIWSTRELKEPKSIRKLLRVIKKSNGWLQCRKKWSL